MLWKWQCFTLLWLRNIHINIHYVCMGAVLLQLCPTLCDAMDCSLPGSSVHGILQARILEWVATPSSRGSSPPRVWTWVSCSSCIAGGFFTAGPLGKPQIPFIYIYVYTHTHTHTHTHTQTYIYTHIYMHIYTTSSASNLLMETWFASMS